MIVLNNLMSDYSNSSSNSYYITTGFFLIFISTILLIFKNKVLNWREKSGDELFSKEFRKTHEFRTWLIIIVFFILGIWLLVKYL
jgi:hypothetical protein